MLKGRAWKQEKEPEPPHAISHFLACVLFQSMSHIPSGHTLVYFTLVCASVSCLTEHHLSLSYVGAHITYTFEVTDDGS